MKTVYIDCYYGFNSAMLLSALLDAGVPREETIEKARETISDFDIKITDAKANAMDCKMAQTLGDVKGNQILSELGVLSALEVMGAELVICSGVYLGDNADGEVIFALESSGIETLPSSDIKYSLSLADASFLISLCAESGPLPRMDIISVGYGTAEGTEDSLVTVYVGEYNEESNIFSKEENMITV